VIIVLAVNGPATTLTGRHAQIASSTAADRIPGRASTVSILEKIRHKA